MFNPRNQVELYVSNFMRFMHPYLAFITYRFHVEKAREIGKYIFADAAGPVILKHAFLTT